MQTSDGEIPERWQGGVRLTDPAEQLIDRLAIEQAVRMLPTGYRSAFILHDIEGYNHEEAARLSAHTVGTSKSQLHHARASLRAVLSGRALNGLALGEDIAVALGQHVVRTRLLMFVVVAVLCGAATAACGPITFVGLVVPHLARLLCGPDYRWILAYAAVLTPVVLLGADVLGRLVLRNGELQVGVVLGVLGAPVFILLVRSRNLVKL